MSFDKEKIAEKYPEAEELMMEPMKIWKLPAGKEDKLTDICESGEYFLQEKIDGAFYQYVRTPNYAYLFGRSVSTVTGLLTEKSENVPHIMEALQILPPNTILIGEIYYPGKTSKDVTGIMGCLAEEAIKRQQGSRGLIHYYVHDIVMLNGEDLMDLGAEDRYKILQETWYKYFLKDYDFLRLATVETENLQAKIASILAAGGEGAVLKKKDYPYIPGKRPAWSTVKIKQMDATDLVCIGFCPPTKEYTGKEFEVWPYWMDEEGNKVFLDGSDIVGYYSEAMTPITKYYYYDWYSAIKIGAYDEDGNLVEIGTVSSGLTDEMKQNMSENPDAYLGKVVALACMSIDKKAKTLRHPALREWREDKDPHDCTMKEIFG